MTEFVVLTRCRTCGGRLHPDADVDLGYPDETLRCLQCGRDACHPSRPPRADEQPELEGRAYAYRPAPSLLRRLRREDELAQSGDLRWRVAVLAPSQAEGERVARLLNAGEYRAVAVQTSAQAAELAEQLDAVFVRVPAAWFGASAGRHSVADILDPAVRETAPPVLRAEGLTFRPDQAEVTVGDQTVGLSPTETDFLACLMQRPEAWVSVRHLARDVWRWPELRGNTVSVLAGRLRAKLGDAGRPHRYIESRPGLGYRFRLPVAAGEGT